MAHKHNKKTAIGDKAGRQARKIWDRGNLYEWRASLSARRRQHDERTLKAIFNEASRVPELKDALDWAEDNDIEFIVDRKTRLGGYYLPGAGIVAIRSYNPLLRWVFKAWTREFEIGIIVHEIRHAWQNVHDLLASSRPDFASAVIHQTLTEADARAHQRLAGHQFYLARRMSKEIVTDQFETLTKELEKSRYDKTMLWEHFKHWYKTSAVWYGKRAASYNAAHFKVDAAKIPDEKYEFCYKPVNKPTPCIGMNTADWNDLRRLGKGFKGPNYFDVAERDILYKEFLSHSKSTSLFGKAKPDHLTRVEKIRVAILKEHFKAKPA